MKRICADFVHILLFMVHEEKTDKKRTFVAMLL